MIVPKSRYKAHVKLVHDIGETYMCELCGHKTGSKGSHEYHFESKHTDKKYECDICGEVYVENISYIRSLYGLALNYSRIHILFHVASKPEMLFALTCGTIIGI